MTDYSILTELLDIHNLRVTHYQLVDAERINLFVESTLNVAVCPKCTQVSSKVHETGNHQMVRDLSLWGRCCWLAYAPRRFKCSRCRETFVERLTGKKLG
jgi:transposase